MPESELANLMAASGFYLADTGGGCTAYTRQEPDGSVTFITLADDANAPSKVDDKCTITRALDDTAHSLGQASDARNAVLVANRQ